MAEESGKLLPAIPMLPTPPEDGPKHSPMTTEGDLAYVSAETPHSVHTVHLSFAHSPILPGSEEWQLLCWRLTCPSVFWNMAYLPFGALDPSVSSFFPVTLLTSPQFNFLFIFKHTD